MPQAPRFSKKGTKIAYALLGTPQNILAAKKESAEQKRINEQLMLEQTSRSK